MFIRWYFILILMLHFVLPLHAQEGGYVHPISVSKGEALSIHISTSVTLFDLKIYRMGSGKELITTFSSVVGIVRQIPDSSYWYGCNWPVSYEFLIPQNWKPGIYVAEFPTLRGIKGATFFVKENDLGSYSKILVKAGVNTWQAYNGFGGKSLYDGSTSGATRSYKVSFNRPLTEEFGVGQRRWIASLASYLESQNVPVEVCTDIDLYKDSHYLDNYSVLVIVGHDEYWSRPERRAAQEFLARGGNIIIFGGNTCWWQVRYEESDQSIVCYRQAVLDPLAGIADSLLTINWYAHPVNYPENIFTGVSWRNGGYVAYGSVLPKSLGYGDYTVYKSHHWLYKGTGLNDGDSFGGKNDIVGYETDGALFTWQNGFPVVTGTDYSPGNYQILGISPGANGNGTLRGHGTMGMYKVSGGGWVFNAATTDWVDGLETDSIVQQITKNVLQRFSSNRFPPEIYSWSPFRVVSDSIHDELVYLNRREFLVLPEDSLVMALFASDPAGGPIHYFWTQNDTVVSQANVFTYRNTASAQDYSKETSEKLG